MMNLVASYENYNDSSWFNSEFQQKDEYANNMATGNARHRESNPYLSNIRNVGVARRNGATHLVQTIKQINVYVAEYQKALAKIDVDTSDNICDISTLLSVGYDSSNRTLDEYSKALKRTNGGALISFLVRANIPPSIAKDQIRAAVLGAVEAMMLGFSQKTGAVLYPTHVDAVQFQQLIADRLGNLTRDEAMVVSKIVFEEILTRDKKTKLVVNGGAISVGAKGQLLAYPMTRLGARTLLQMHLKKSESEVHRFQE